MPITFQTGRPHDHLGEKERGREKDGWMGWWVGEEGVMERDKRRGWRGEGDAKGGERGLEETASNVAELQ